MIIKQYGLELESLRAADLELLRSWRNSHAISRHMEYRAHITPAMQRSWYAGIQTLSHFYFMIRREREAVGLIHLTRVTEQEAEAGLFIGVPAYQGTALPVRASLCLLNFAFDDLQLSAVRAKVKRDNEAALRYNESLGFARWEDADHPDFTWMRLGRERFRTKARPLLRAAAPFGAQRELIFEPTRDLDLLIAEEVRKENATPGEDS